MRWMWIMMGLLAGAAALTCWGRGAGRFAAPPRER